MTPPHFCIFVIISPLKRNWPLICTILNSPYLRMICTKFHWKWRTGSREENFWNVLFRYYLPLGKGVVLHLYNSECPLPKDELCQLWLKLAQWFWRRSWKSKSLTDRRQTDGQTDDGQKAIRKAHLSFQLRWAKKPFSDWIPVSGGNANYISAQTFNVHCCQRFVQGYESLTLKLTCEDSQSQVKNFYYLPKGLVTSRTRVKY
jgi:hypothetical protein